MKLFSLVVLSSLLLPSFAAQAGQLLSYKQEETGSTGFMRMYLEPTKMKVEFQEEADLHTMIFEKEKEEATVIDHKKKEYTVIDKATMDKISAKVGGAMAQMEAAMKNMPPEMAKMMKEKMKMVGPGAGEKLDVKKVASGESVGKWKATHYEVSMGAKKLTDTWTVPLKDLGVDTKDLQIVKDMGKLFEGATKNLSPMIGGGTADYQLWNKMEGMPVKTVRHSKKGEKTMILDKAEQKSFSSSDFSIPSGYKKKEFAKM